MPDLITVLQLGLHEGRVGGNSCLPNPAGHLLPMEPRMSLVFQAARVHCWLTSRFSLTRILKFFSAGLISRRLLLICILMWEYLHPSAKPCILLCWSSLGSQEPTFQIYQGLSGWYSFLLWYQLHCSVWCQHTCWGCTQSHHLHHWKKSTRLKIYSWGTSLLPSFHLNIESLITKET